MLKFSYLLLGIMGKWEWVFAKVLFRTKIINNSSVTITTEIDLFYQKCFTHKHKQLKLQIILPAVAIFSSEVNILLVKIPSWALQVRIFFPFLDLRLSHISCSHFLKSRSEIQSIWNYSWLIIKAFPTKYPELQFNMHSILGVRNFKRLLKSSLSRRKVKHFQNLSGNP